MEIFKRTIRIYIWKIVYFGLLLTSFGLGGVAIAYQEQPWSQLASGAAVGLFVAVVQMTFHWVEHRQIEELRKLRITRLIPHRDDEALYGDLIEKSRNTIWLMGHTASRFLEDFANRTREDKKELIRAIRKGVEVRILAPHPDVLDESAKARAQDARQRMLELRRDFPSNFAFRYFRHQPSHSLFRVDHRALVGPMFPGKEASRNLPATETDVGSALGAPYLDYFELIWSQAENDPD